MQQFDDVTVVWCEPIVVGTERQYIMLPEGRLIAVTQRINNPVAHTLHQGEEHLWLMNHSWLRITAGRKVMIEVRLGAIPEAREGEWKPNPSDSGIIIDSESDAAVWTEPDEDVRAPLEWRLVLAYQNLSLHK